MWSWLQVHGLLSAQHKNLKNATVWRRGKPQAGTSHTHLRWTSWAPGTWWGAFSTVLSRWQLWQDPCSSGNAPDTTGSSCCAAEGPPRGDIAKSETARGSNTVIRAAFSPPLVGLMRPAQLYLSSNLPGAPQPHSSHQQAQENWRTSRGPSKYTTGVSPHPPWLSVSLLTSPSGGLTSLLTIGSNTTRAKIIFKSLSALKVELFLPIVPNFLYSWVQSLHHVLSFC